MKAVDVLETAKRDHIIEQLHKLNYTDTEGKSYRELKHKLATFQAIEVNVNSPESKWFW